MWDWHSGWGLFSMVIGMAAFWGLVAWFAVALARGSRTDRQESRRPIDVLDERFARGEIDTDEYERRRRLLV